VIEKTLVILKPDAYALNLTGEIISRFERCGLTLEQIRVSTGEVNMLERHYPRDDAWLSSVGTKTLADYQKAGLSAQDQIGTGDAVEIGKIIRTWLIQFMKSGPVVPMVISGNRAVEKVRKLVGHTLPIMADAGTIRGDYSSDSAELANTEGRSVHNLVHASGDSAEAARELELWFPDLKA
jgi:nucleoside-diphosphate kinase